MHVQAPSEPCYLPKPCHFQLYSYVRPHTFTGSGEITRTLPQAAAILDVKIMNRCETKGHVYFKRKQATFKQSKTVYRGKCNGNLDMNAKVTQKVC